jgi:hypothetical protein
MIEESKLRPDEHADYKHGFREGCNNAYPECPDTLSWLDVDTLAKWLGYRDGQNYRSQCGEDKTPADYEREAGFIIINELT